MFNRSHRTGLSANSRAQRSRGSRRVGRYEDTHKQCFLHEACTINTHAAPSLVLQLRIRTEREISFASEGIVVAIAILGFMPESTQCSWSSSEENKKYRPQHPNGLQAQRALECAPYSSPLCGIPHSSFLCISSSPTQGSSVGPSERGLGCWINEGLVEG